jgi:HK97 gp10 family phage protein
MSGMKVKVQLTGLEEYIENLRKAGANIDEVVSEAIQESAKPIFEDIRSWAEKHERTGAVLKGVEMTEVQRDGDKFFVDVGISTEKSPEAWHAVFTEYGTPKMKADPGVWPAFKKNRAKVKKIQRDILQRGGIPID